MPRPRSPHPHKHPLWPLLLVGVLAGCGETITAKDGAAACAGAGCGDAAEADGGLTPTGRRSAPGEEGDSATDLSSDLAPLPPDFAPPDSVPPPLDAAVDPAPDVSVVVPPDAAPVLAPDVALLPVPPDAAPDVAMISPPDAEPDAPPPPPDLPPPPPDLPPPPPDLMPAPPDLMPPAPDLMPDPGNGCPAAAGPAMVRADLGSAPFCIDSSEVTNAHYAAFLAATGNGSQTSGQPTACSWNSTYLPGTDGSPWPYAAGKGNRPVVNVDWCDARAYCKWAGKRLCGKIGGGSLTGWMAAVDPPTSQWANACTRSWQRVYPYGDTFKSSSCNVNAPNENAQYIADVKSYSQCEGGYTGLFDMSGNVEEWVDACDKNTGSGDGCASAGASTWLDGLTPAEITCADSLYPTPRSTKWVMLGFRCCADQ
jgi:sulfatase modifying factor 1